MSDNKNVDTLGADIENSDNTTNLNNNDSTPVEASNAENTNSKPVEATNTETTGNTPVEAKKVEDAKENDSSSDVKKMMQEIEEEVAKAKEAVANKVDEAKSGVANKVAEVTANVQNFKLNDPEVSEVPARPLKPLSQKKLIKTGPAVKKRMVMPGVSPEDVKNKPLQELKKEIVSDTSNMSQYEIDAVIDFVNSHRDVIKPPIMTQREIDLLIEFIIEQGIELGNHEFTEDEIDELNYRRFA